MVLVVSKGKKYYKYEDFVQPVLTENGTMGGDSFACDQSTYYTENSGDEQKAWYVFDGKFNGQEWQVNSVSLTTWYWLSWYNPQPIKISKVGVTNAAGQYSMLAWKLQGSNDNSTWTDLTTGTNENVSAVTTWYMEIPEEKQGFYKYYRIYCQPRSTTALMIRELTITAITENIVQATSSNYGWVEYDSYKTYILTRKKRTYYKYGTDPNAIIVGSPTIDKGVVSGFSLSNYLQYMKDFNISTANNWEIVCKFRTSTDVNTQQHILFSGRSTAAGNSCGAYINVYSGNIQFYLPLTATLSSAISFKYTASANTEYVIKVEFTGSAYNLYVNGQLVETKASTSKGLYNANYNDKLIIGTDGDYTAPFFGSIDTTQSYIKINGEDWWVGTKIIESTSNDYDYYEDTQPRYLFTRNGKFY